MLTYDDLIPIGVLIVVMLALFAIEWWWQRSKHE